MGGSYGGSYEGRGLSFDVVVDAVDARESLRLNSQTVLQNANRTPRARVSAQCVCDDRLDLLQCHLHPLALPLTVLDRLKNTGDAVESRTAG